MGLRSPLSTPHVNIQPWLLTLGKIQNAWFGAGVESPCGFCKKTEPFISERPGWAWPGLCHSGGH